MTVRTGKAGLRGVEKVFLLLIALILCLGWLSVRRDKQRPDLARKLNDRREGAAPRQPPVQTRLTSQPNPIQAPPFDSSLAPAPALEGDSSIALEFVKPVHCSYVPLPESPKTSADRGPPNGYMNLVLTRLRTSPPSVVVTNDYATGMSIENHIDREMAAYRVLNLILKNVPKGDVSQYIDAGSNHGVFSTNAALNNATIVYAIEPQPHLRQRMRYAFRLNGVSDQIRIFPYAVLDTDQTITLTGMEGDGGVAHIDLKNTAALGDKVNVKTTRLDCLPLDPGSIAALKIDIEGFELFGLESASGLFDAQRVEHVFVEFGPPARWKAFNSATAEDAIALLKKMHDQWGFEFTILPSFGYEYMRQTGLVTERVISGATNYLVLPRENYDKMLYHLDYCNELFVWWQLKKHSNVERFIKAFVTA